MKLTSISILPLALVLASGCCSNKPTYPANLPAYHRPPHGSTQPLPPPPVVITPLPSDGVAPGGTNLVLHLKTEDLAVSRRTESAGAVRVRKYIVTETKAIPTLVCHDEYEVVRVPANEPTTLPFWEGERWIEIPLTKEAVAPVTRSRIYEVITIKKNTVCVTNLITGEVRTEKIEVK